MADEDLSREAPAPAERRLAELLSLLGTEAFPSREGFTAGLVQRARRQQDTRAVLVVGSGVLAAAASGLLGLIPSASAEERPR